MTYKGPGGYGRIMNIVMNTAMCAVFSFFMLWTMQQRVGGPAQILTPTNFVISFITAFGIGYVVADLIPVFHAGDSVAKKLGLSGVPGYFVTVLIIDLILTTIISFLMTFINMVDKAGLAGAVMSWAGMYPIMLVIGYVVQLIAMKPAMILAKNVSGFDPDNPMPPAGMPGMPPMGAPGGPAAGGPADPGAGGPGAGGPAGPGAGGPGQPRP